MERAKDYYQLAKPGLVYGNLITAIAGYFLASKLRIHLVQFIAMAVGTALIMGAACAINNLYDQDIDLLMQRTKTRPSANGSISTRSGLIFAGLLVVIGVSLLSLFTNWLCVSVGLVGLVIYALIYTKLKRKTHHSTLIGSLAGAAPIIGGYVAYADRLSGTALIAGMMMLIWQMPHFYAIALYREKDYRAARIPLLPIVKGQAYTVRTMIAYNLLYIVALVSLYFYASLNLAYLIILGAAAISWLGFNLKGLKLTEFTVWAKRSFIYSLATVLVMSVMLAVG